MPALVQSPADVINGQILLAQGDHFLAHRVPLGYGLRTFTRREEKLPMRILTKLMAQDPKTARGVAEVSCGLGRGKTLNEVGPQGLILAMGGIGRIQEHAGEICYVTA